MEEEKIKVRELIQIDCPKEEDFIRKGDRYHSHPLVIYQDDKYTAYLVRIYPYKELGPDYELRGGFGNGYVSIPKDHPLYGKEFMKSDYNLEVHGGLTYSRPWNESHVWGKEDRDEWVFGFDTMHLWSYETCRTLEDLYYQTRKLLFQLMTYKEAEDE